MSDEPLVSVIIPTYRRNRELVRAVESVEDQSYENLDVIVVNDAPRNRLPEKISKNSEITVTQHKENRGGAAARNTGLDKADGKYVAFLDDDDFFHSDKISRQVRKMENSSKDCFGCFTWHVFYESEEDLENGKGKVIEENTEDILYRLLRGFDIRIGGSSSLLLRRNAIEEAERFDERFPRHQDWELLVKMLENGSIDVVKDPLFSKVGNHNPAPEKLRKSKRLYLEKFRDEIRTLSGEKRRRVYRDHYSNLSESFFQEGQNLKGVLWFLKALRYTENLSKVSYSDWPPRIDNRV